MPYVADFRRLSHNRATYEAVPRLAVVRLAPGDLIDVGETLLVKSPRRQVWVHRAGYAARPGTANGNLGRLAILDVDNPAPVTMLAFNPSVNNADRIDWTGHYPNGFEFMISAGSIQTIQDPITVWIEYLDLDCRNEANAGTLDEPAYP